ncbi:pseudomonalisin precursor [Lentilactobacillus sunkii]|jgi:kumamolisin|uniref:Pseudomonalisin n=1 Tax=Lentilactobacillus sunkii TaxID=481719 RepID=A0A1E7XGG9_9LACO|nr:S53 family peptidase [Lentilactobacillus sunkii]OFA12215.1 pseudomonalisin precursor [Lentilactobacillus sunkii]
MIKARKLIVGIASLAVLLAVSPATQASTQKKPAGKDPYGINKILKQLLAKKKLSPNKTVSLDIVLKPQNEDQLTNRVYAVNTPGNSDFKNFYTPTQFRGEFGQPASVVGEFKPFFKKYNLKSHAFSNGLIIRVDGKVKNINKAFATNLQTAKYHSNPVQFSSKKPVMPDNLADHVMTILGITTISAGGTGIATNKTKTSKPLTKSSPNKFVKQYNLQPLYDKGYKGQGQTVGIITFAGFSKKDAETFWKGEGIDTKPNRLSVKKVKAPAVQTTNTASNQLETMLDVEQSGAIAPQADVRVYQSNFSDVGMANTFATAFDENKASSLSLSWGLNEYLTHYYYKSKLLTPVYGQAMTMLMAQGALQGISTFVASGDSGAYSQGIGAKLGPFSIPNYSTYADFPSDNPWVTATGGTTLPFSKKLDNGIKVSVDKERAWGADYMYKAYGQNRKAFQTSLTDFMSLYNAGGGGISTLYDTPQYQQDVPGVNTFNAREYLSNLLQPRINPPLLSGTQYGRNYPDVSANADPNTGYQIYTKVTGWQNVGGTSAVAPQFNGATAVINSGKGTRMGLWNAQIYKLAQNPDKDKDPFTVLDSDTNNSNLYYTGQPGKVYNQATGLGTVNFEKLYDAYQ